MDMLEELGKVRRNLHTLENIINQQAVEIERLQIEAANFRSLLERCLKVAMSGHWRDKANLSIEAHPVWDDVRAALTAAAEVGSPDKERAERLRLELEKIAWMDEFLDAEGARAMMNIAREAINNDN